jgi:hypothetical protein
MVITIEMKWLFLLHQVQTPNSRERVKVWRAVKKVGAVLHRNSVYVLPYNKERLEDFQWLCQQVRDSKGEASVFVSEASDEAEDATLQALFVRSSDEQYTTLLSKAGRLLKRIQQVKKTGRLSKRLLKVLTKETQQLAVAFAEVDRTDFFDAPLAKKARAASEEVTKSLADVEPQAQTVTSPQRRDRRAFQGKTWATRQHIHIDRLCSAWLIRRFIDPKAKFVFAPESKLPCGAVLFDVFGTEFGHHGEDCTFETLVKAFHLKDNALKALAEIVHDIDMKDQKFGRAEASGLDLVVRALSTTLPDDHRTLEAGSVVLDTLYKYFAIRKPRTARPLRADKP